MDTSNPYRSPDAKLASDDILPILPAEQWRRFVTLLIDYAAFFVLSIVIGLIIGILGGAAAVRHLQQMPQLVLGIIVILIYYVPLEILFGRTLGKFIMGTKVVNEAGGKPSVGQIFGRTFCRFIPFEAFSFLASGGRGWHDSIPKTYVVKTR